MKNKDYIGQKINKWEILDFEKDERGGKWLCRCECGEEKWQKVYNIKNEKSKMCKKCSGEKRRKEKSKKPKKERIIKIRFDSNKEWSEENTFIGTYKEYLEECRKRREEKKRKNKYIPISNERTYKIYSKMKERCYNKNSSGYKNYGGRGIKICEEWLNNYLAFKNWSIANGYRDDLTIDRIDVNGDYEPNNCRWATYKQQANNKRVNHYITYNNITHTLQEWSEKYNIQPKTLSERLKRGIPFEIAILKEIPQQYKKKKRYEDTKKYQKDRITQIRKLKKVLHKVVIKKLKERAAT